MADEDPTPADPIPASDPDPSPPEPPTAEVILATEREARARLEGEVAALRAELDRRGSPPVATPGPAAPATLPTLEQIEAAYQANQITAEQRQEYRHALIARAQAAAVLAEQQAQTTRQSVERENATRLRELMDAHPDLTRAASPLLLRVQAELEVLERRGLDPKTPASQVLAIERVVGSGGVMDARDYARRRIPVGGTGGGYAVEPQPGTKGDPLKGLPRAFVDFWSRQGRSAEEIAEMGQTLTPTQRERLSRASVA